MLSISIQPRLRRTCLTLLRLIRYKRFFREKPRAARFECRPRLSEWPWSFASSSETFEFPAATFILLPFTGKWGETDRGLTPGRGPLGAISSRKVSEQD